jgi:gas vesicle protein
MWCVRSVSRTRTDIVGPRNDELSAVLALSCKSNFGTGVSQMKPGIKNEIAGKVHEVKGKIREKASQNDERSQPGRQGYCRKDSREGSE